MCVCMCVRVCVCACYGTTPLPWPVALFSVCCVHAGAIATACTHSLKICKAQIHYTYSFFRDHTSRICVLQTPLFHSTMSRADQDRINTPHMTAYIMKSQTPLHTLFCCGSSHWGAAYYKSHDTYSLAKDLHTYTLRICIWNSAVEQLRVLSYLISAVVGSFLLDLCGIFFLLTWSLLASYLISFCFLLDLFLFLTWSLFPSYLVPFCFLLDLCGTAVGPLLLDLCSVQFAHAQWQRCTEA
jgi:hypothetical protein